MVHPITLENDALRVEIWPAYGSKVASVVDKHDNHELLFSHPCELPAKSDYDIDYGDGCYVGWDECFPGIAPGPYPGQPYDGIRVPDHGEVWGIPSTVTPANDGITTRWHGIRFAYHLTRNLRLDGSSLVASYELENLAPFPFRYVWALHSLMAMTSPVELRYAGSSDWRWSHDANGTPLHRPFQWPEVQPDENLAIPSDLPAGKAWKAYSNTPISHPFTLAYPQRKRQLTISYESATAVTGYWGLWLNTGGWAGHRHVAIEPTTGRFDHLDQSVKDHSAATVQPLSKASWTVRWTLEDLA